MTVRCCYCWTEPVRISLDLGDSSSLRLTVDYGYIRMKTPLESERNPAAFLYITRQRATPSPALAKPTHMALHAPFRELQLTPAVRARAHEHLPVP